MDLEARNQTINTYIGSADALADYFEDIGSRKEDVDRAMQLLGPRDDLPVVVEVGCGNGRDAVDILKYTPYYVGFDISPRMIELARQANSGGAFVQADLRYFFNGAEPNGHIVDKKSVDIVFAFASLLHSDEDELELHFNNVYEFLSEGGVYYISLKQGTGTSIKVDEYGVRTFHLYQPEDIQRLAGDHFDTVFIDTQAIGNTDWFTLALRKAQHAGTA